MNVKAVKIIELAKSKGIKIAIAESCTGGLISAALTSINGSSSVFDCGYITYSNESKIKILGISSDIINQFGAVSPEVTQAMATGIHKNSPADLCLSISGNAGPSGEPLGRVYIGCLYKGNITTTQFNLSGSRDQIRNQCVELALDIMLNCLI